VSTTVNFVVYSSNTPATTTYSWNFGDGATTTTPSTSVYHTYTQSGVFVPRVTRLSDGSTDLFPINVLPTIKNFNASAGQVSGPGQPSTLSWTTSGATSVTINGATVTGSNLVVKPTETTIYTIKATGAGGSVSASLTVKVPFGLVWKREVVYLGSLAIAEIDANGTHELHCDHLGTPRVITIGSGSNLGAVEGRQAYAPYGERLVSTGYVPLIGFTGHQQTDPTGMIYMRGRFYSPQWHCFLNPDGGADTNQLSQYAYCGGNPMMRTDPSGMLSLGSLIGDVCNGFHGFSHAMGVNLKHFCDYIIEHQSGGGQILFDYMDSYFRSHIGDQNNSQDDSSQTEQGTNASSSPRFVLVLVWKAKFPYFFFGGSVGHMAVFEIPSGDTVVSQFPEDGGLPGSPNETKTLSGTIDKEERAPNFVFFVAVTNSSAMNAQAARERGTEEWTMWRTENGTQCTVSGTAVLQAGGTPIGNHWLPGFAGRDLQRLAQNSSATGVYQINSNWFAGTLW